MTKMVSQSANHILLTDLMETRQADRLLTELGRCNWERRSTDFFELDVCLDAPNIMQRKHALLRGLARRVNSIAVSEWGIAGRQHGSVQFHRYLTGTGCALHSDAQDPSLRLLVFLRNEKQPADGGMFVWGRPGHRRVTLIEPQHNTGVLFLPSKGALHGVSQISSGARYTMVLRIPTR